MTREPIILIGRAPSKASDDADRLLDGCTAALQDFTTEELHAIADDRDDINPGGWMQTMIRQYIEVWR
jgi:hypothetical protein